MRQRHRAALLLAAALLLVALIGLLLRWHDPGVDRAIMLAMREPGDPAEAIGPAWLERVMLAVTMLGNGEVLTAITALAVAGLLLGGRRRTALLIAAATILGSSVVTLAKHGFARPRPDLVEHLVLVTSPSFPSGHAANSAIVYLTLAALLTRVVPWHGGRRAMIGAAMSLVVTIGISRVYLGVHWPSDVAAGWIFGGLWAMGWLELGRALAPQSSVPDRTNFRYPREGGDT